MAPTNLKDCLVVSITECYPYCLLRGSVSMTTLLVDRYSLIGILVIGHYVHLDCHHDIHHFAPENAKEGEDPEPVCPCCRWSLLGFMPSAPRSAPLPRRTDYEEENDREFVRFANERDRGDIWAAAHGDGDDAILDRNPLTHRSGYEPSSSARREFIRKQQIQLSAPEERVRNRLRNASAHFHREANIDNTLYTPSAKQSYVKLNSNNFTGLD